MSYLEIQKKEGKEYYYITKNIRVNNNKWKKVRKYLGNKKPNDKDIKKAIEELESKIKEEKLVKEDSYLDESDLEFLEDVKQGYSEWIKKTPKPVLKKNNENFIIRFTYDSNAIEGNRLTLRETSLILKDKLMPSGASAKDVQEAINGRKCMEYLFNYEGNITNKLIWEVNKILLQDIEDVTYPGRYRFFDVEISGTNYKPPKNEDVKKLMTKLINDIKRLKSKMHPFELASYFHIEFERIHPFEDGNGRTGRAIMNLILYREKYPLVFIPFKKREEYYKALDRYNEGDKKQYYNLIFNIIRDQIKDYGHKYNKNK